MARLDEIEFIGSGLNRPECVLTHQSGLLITADWTDSGGISLVAQDGVVLRLDGDGNLFERALRSNEWRPITFEKSESGFGGDSVYRLQRHVIDHLVDGSPVANSAQDYIANIVIEDAIYKSATSQCVQEISL